MRATRWAIGLGAAAAAGALVSAALRSDPHWAERHLLASYCATSGAEAFAASAVPWLAGAVAVAALALLARAVLGLGRARLRPPSASTCGAVALAVVASLVITELYLRRLEERLMGGVPHAGEGGAAMARPDPVLGWAYVPGRTTWVDLAGHRIAYSIDADGDRAATPDARADSTDPTVLFAGESIAFGYGLSYEETFPFLVGRDLGVATRNVAVVGYGTDQAYRRAVEALARLSRPVAVVMLFIPDQLRRNVDPWRPRLALGPGGVLAPVPPRAGPRLLRLLHELPWHGDEALRLTAALLRATAEAARARGAFPLFVVTNYGRACRADGDEAWIVRELFERQGLPFVRLDLEPEDRLPGLFERHPGPRGARRIAAAVEAALAPRLSRAPPRPEPAVPE